MSAKRTPKKGYRKKRKVRPKEKNVVKGYDSNWEYVLHTGLLSKWEHHPKSQEVSYTVSHTYHPDFVMKVGSKTILLESKGRFWDYGEYNKYVWIRKALPKNTELVFLFAEPNAPMPAAKRRKDGTKRSHAEWAWKNEFKWFSEDSLPDGWVDVDFKNNLKKSSEEDYEDEA